jgi:hypothetical protein
VNAESAVKALAGLRIVIGVAAWLAPRQSGRGFGLDPGANEQAPYRARLFGARDVALGAGTLRGLVLAPAIAAVGLGLAAPGGADSPPE